MLKILFIASNPGNSLMLDQEFHNITAKILAAAGPHAVEIDSIWAARRDDLLQGLNQYRPDVVHFSGHGSKTGELILMNRDGQAKPVSAAAIGKLFAAVKDQIRLVVFNACFSEIAAAPVANTIDCTVGMDAEIGDDAAIVFASAFYSAIAFKRSVADAFEQAKAALLLEGLPEDDLPRLFHRHGIDPAKLFVIVDHKTCSNATLIDALLQCASLADRSSRDTIVGQLPAQIRNSIRRSDVARVDVINAVVEVKAATARSAVVHPVKPPTPAAQPVAPGGEVAATSDPAADDPAAEVSVTFADFISDLCTQIGWKLSDFDDELAVLEFDVGADRCQVVLLTPDESGLVIRAPSGPTFETEADIPDELSSSLLKRNAANRYTHWLIIKIEDQYLYACTSNLDPTKIDALGLKTAIELVIKECGAGLTDSINDAAESQLGLDWAQFHFN